MKKNFKKCYALFGPVLKCRTLRISIVLATLLICVSSLQIQAADTAKDLKVSVRFENASLREVISYVESNSKYRFFYNNRTLNSANSVTISLSEVAIDKALVLLLREAGISFKIHGEQIVLKRGRDANSVSEVFESSHRLTLSEGNPLVVADRSRTVFERIISGRVTGETGEPLPGVNVVMKGTAIGTTTDSDGLYRLSVSDDAKITLVFSFIGYQTREIEVTGQTVIDLGMTPEVQTLEEVVVVGYGTQKKVNLTGAVDVVSRKSLEGRSPGNVGTLLQGLSPNLNIGLTRRGGEPGSSNDFSIRGLGSLSGGGPLILVDGFQMDINNLDPESIESVSILKDAASSAIYGSRAPFGVILITTKKGTKHKEVTVTYSNNIAFTSPIHLPKWQNSLRYVTAYNQSLANSGQPAKFSDAQIDRITRHMQGTYLPEYDTVNPPGDLWAMRHQGNANYEWFDEYFRDVTVNQKHNISVTGGDEKNQYYVSTGLFDQGGAYNYGEEYYRRYNVLANLTSQVTPWLRLNVNTKYANLNSTHPMMRQGGIDPDRNFVLSEIIKFFPTTPKKLVTGELSNVYALIMENGGKATENGNDLYLTLGGELEPVKGWKTTFLYNYNYTGSKYSYLLKDAMALNARGQYIRYSWAPPGGAYDEVWNSNNYKAINLYSSYEKSVSNHFFKVLLGYENEYRYYSTLTGSRGGIITYDVPSISTATGPYTLDDGKSHWATEGFFGRLTYNYMEKYLFEVNGRYSGSSKFAEKERWGFFPSVSAGYNISKERFWDPLVHVVNDFKIRGSYGSLGNQNVANYLYLPIVPISTELEWILGNVRPNSASMPGIISPTLTWETINTLDFGVDAGFLQNKLGITFDWYKRNTLNMFGPATILPAALGTSPPQENNAELETKGYEIIAEWRDETKNGLAYSIRATFSDAKSVITKYLNTAGLIDSYYAGKEYGEIWGYETDGIIQSDSETIPDQTDIYPVWGPGDIKYADLNGDGKVDDGTRTLDDHGDLKVIGNRTPRYMVGISGSVSWKNFDFSIFGAGLLRRNLVLGQYDNMMWGVGTQGNNGGAFYDGHDDYWRPANETNLFGPNTDAYFAKPYVTNETLKNQVPQTRYMLETGYFRIKNVQLGYNIPVALANRLHLQKVHIYISGENLYTIDNLPSHIDPETSNAGSMDNGGWTLGAIYPLSRAYSVGLNVTF